MKIFDTKVTVRDIEVYGYHGVLDEERVVGNKFRVSVSLDYDATAAMRYDDIEQAVNYANVVDVVKSVLTARSSALIENLAYRLIEDLTAAFPAVTGGEVTVTKVHPPISVPNGGASFTASFKV